MKSTRKIRALVRGVLCLAGSLYSTYSAAGSQGIQAPAAGAIEQTKRLEMGDPAPPLRVKKWIKGGPIEGFEAGKVYVLDFWATWCGPCRRAIPHISALAQRYQGQAQFIGIDVDEKSDDSGLSEAALLERSTTYVNGMNGQMDYPVAMDDDQGTMTNSWTKAAGQVGIPAVFIVKDGMLVWIGGGNPAQIDAPLEQILTGHFDLTKARETRNQEKVAWNEFFNLRSYRPFEDSRVSKDYRTLVAMYREAFAINPKLEEMMFGELFGALVHTSPIEACSYARKYLETRTPRKENVVDRVETLETFVEEAIGENTKAGHTCILDLALEFAQEGMELEKDSTSSRFYPLLAEVYFKKGNVDHAISIIDEGIDVARKLPDYDPSRKRILKQFDAKLNEYKEVKAGKHKRAQGPSR